MERLSTGNGRLDEVLGGGLVLDAITLVVGAPGTGKTILAEQCLFANATRDRPGLYLSTVSEPFDKLLRYGQSLEFFDIAELGQAVFYDDLGADVHKDGLAGVLDRIDSLLKRHAPGIVVIDSFKALRTFAADDAEFRRFLHDLAGRAQRAGCLVVVGGRVRARRSDHLTRIRGRRWRDRTRDETVSRTFDPVPQRAQAARQRLPLRGPRVSHHRRRTGGLPAPRRSSRQRRVRHDQRSRFDRDRGPRRRTRGGLLVRFHHARRRPIGRRQDDHGPALRVRRRRT